MARLTDEDWLPYVSKRKGEGASPGTINRERSALLHMLNIMRLRKILKAAPLLGRQRGPQGKLVYPTPEESQRLLLAAQEDVSPLAHRFVMVTLYTGLRHSAALDLRAGDVDVQRRILWIGKDKAGRREQPMPQVLAQYLGKVIKGMETEAYLFPSHGCDQRCARRSRCGNYPGNGRLEDKSHGRTVHSRSFDAGRYGGPKEAAFRRRDYTEITTATA